MKKENWRPIEGYEGLYEVSDLGNVRRAAVLCQKTRKDGYRIVNLYKDGIAHEMTVHRLVAKAFLPNPENKPQVNHLDENPKNNALNNLEWATPVENSNYGTRTARIAARNGSKTPIYQIDRDTGIILKEYRSQTVASRETGISVPCINACLRGRQRSAGKFAWQYKNR